MKILNPATNTVVAEVEEDTAHNISDKFSKAKESQKSWAKTNLSERIKCITKFRDLVASQKEKLALTLTEEMGKPITQAKNEINALAGRINFFLQNVEAAMKPQIVFKDAAQKLTETITQEPLGVIANISAWNYPYFVGSNVFIPALLIGNSVLYKPSEFATLTGRLIADLLYQSGIPKDVFALVIGGGATGSALLKHPLAGVFFTGSYSTGQKIAEAASKHLMKVQLELGGKDPTYVCEDVNIKTAAESLADGAFYNTGQSCCSVERIYVHEKIYSAFLEAFVGTVKTFVTGDPKDEKTYIGPLAREAQLSALENQVADAKSKGAKLLTGGSVIKGKGFYFEPTVFSDVNHSMLLMKEESFGPIIGIQKVKGDEEAIQLMNDTPYGLTAGVYCKEESRAQEILEKINSGTVYFNCCDRVSPNLPWSGRGHSGIGTTLSIAGIQTFMQPKAWHWKTV